MVFVVRVFLIPVKRPYVRLSSPDRQKGGVVKVENGFGYMRNGTRGGVRVGNSVSSQCTITMAVRGPRACEAHEAK